MIISEIVTRPVMARKTDSFFIRAKAIWDGANFVQTTIDLGAFVDALGKSVLRIHNIEMQWQDQLQLTPAPSTDYCSGMQITTQSQTGLVGLDDKSVIASGRQHVTSGALSEVILLTDQLDVAPQSWQDGYLVAVESIYFGIDQNANYGLVEASVCLECTVETLTEKAAMALALSQQ